MRHLAAPLSVLVLPMLPERYQRRWPWPAPLSLEALGVLSAYAHTLVSVAFGGICMVLYVQSYSERITELMVQSGDAGRVTWFGMVPFFSFFFTPLGLFCTLYLADSAVRAIHTLGTGTPMGSLFFALPLWLWEKGAGLARAGRLAARYGSAATPPRVRRSGEDLLVRCSRPFPEWNDRLTFAFGEELYRLDGLGEALEGGKRCFEYRFRPWAWEQGTVRSVVRLDPLAAGAPDGPR